MALALALFAERGDSKIIPVVVDHGLQPGSDQVTLQVNKTKKNWLSAS